MQDAGLRMDIVEDQTMGDEMTILDPFALQRPVVGRNQPLASKEDPANKTIRSIYSITGCKFF
jgi:hypothetical protein